MPTDAANESAAPLGYQVKLETIHDCGADLQIRSLLDRQQYFDPEGEGGRAGLSSASWAMFGFLWPSSHVLAHAMLTFDIAGKRVLELGCGLALASLVVHRREGDITASDCHPLAEEFLRHNLLLNALPPMKYRAATWSEEPEPNDELGEFDLIIGSDVLYDRTQPSRLSQFIHRHSAPDVQVLVVDPDRGNRVSFNRNMQALGYTHWQERITQLSNGAPYKGRALNYRRQPSTQV